MAKGRLTKAQILEKINSVLKDDWGLTKPAGASMILAEANLDPGAGDLQGIVSAVLGADSVPDSALQACRTLGDLVELIHQQTR